MIKEDFSIEKELKSSFFYIYNIPKPLKITTIIKIDKIDNDVVQTTS